MTVLDGPRRLDDLPPVGAHVIGGFKGHRVVVDFRFLDRLEHSVDVHPSTMEQSIGKEVAVRPEVFCGCRAFVLEKAV